MHASTSLHGLHRPCSPTPSRSNKEKESNKPKVRVGDEEFDLQTDKEGSDDEADTTLGGGSDDEDESEAESEAESDFEDGQSDNDQSESGGTAIDHTWPNQRMCCGANLTDPSVLGAMAVVVQTPKVTSRAAKAEPRTTETTAKPKKSTPSRMRSRS